MKRTIKSRFVYLPLVLCAMVFAVACSGDDDNKKDDCGCNSPVTETVTDITGRLWFEQEAGYYITEGSGQWMMTYYICNDNAVDIDVPEGGVTVIFDAQLMKYCGVYTDVVPAMAKVTSLEEVLE